MPAYRLSSMHPAWRLALTVAAVAAIFGFNLYGIAQLPEQAQHSLAGAPFGWMYLIASSAVLGVAASVAVDAVKALRNSRSTPSK